MLTDLKDSNQEEKANTLAEKQASRIQNIFLRVVLVVFLIIYFYFFCDHGEQEIDPNKHMRQTFCKYTNKSTVQWFLKSKCHRYKGCQRESVENLTKTLSAVKQYILEYQTVTLDQTQNCQSCQYNSIHLKDNSYIFHSEPTSNLSGYQQVVISPIRYKTFTTPSYISTFDSLRYSNKQIDEYPNIQALTSIFSNITNEWKLAEQIFTLSVCSYQAFRPHIIEVSLVDDCDGKNICIIGANIEQSKVSAANISVLHFYSSIYIRIHCDAQACNRQYDILMIALPSCQVNKIRIFEKVDQYEDEL